MDITISTEDPSIEHFNKLVKLAARAFYDDIGINQRRSVTRRGAHNRGIAVVVLDALTRQKWVRDEDLAKDLKIYATLIRKILQFLVKEKFVEQYNRKETAKGVNSHAAAVAATSTAGGQPPKSGEKTIKLHTFTHSYYRLDYAQIYDVVRYRIHRMKKTLKDELEPKPTIQKYKCPNCGKRFNALDAVWLVSTEDDDFRCESCHGVLVVDSDMIANSGDGDANAASSRKNKLRVKLQNIEVQLKPLMDQIAILKVLKAPDCGSLQTWEAKAKANAAASTENKNDDAFKSFLGETKDQVNVSLFGTANEPNKKLQIPWLTKQSGSPSGEQHGEEMQESKMEGSSKSIGPSDDKKSAAETDESERLRLEAFYQAYYTALFYKRQQEAAAAASSANTSSLIDPSSTRQVGMKSKLEEGDDDDEWEDGTPAGNVNELNLQDDAKPSKEDNENLDWKDG